MSGLEMISSGLLRRLGLMGVTQQERDKAWAPNTSLGAKAAD